MHPSLAPRRSTGGVRRESYAHEHFGVVTVLVVGADQRVALGVAAACLGALDGGDGDEREVVQPLDHPLDQRQQVRAVLVELQDRLAVSRHRRSHSTARQELSERGGLLRRLGEGVEIGVEFGGLLVRHVRLDAVAHHVHAPLEPVVLHVPTLHTRRWANSQSRKNFSVTFVSAFSCSCTSRSSSPASGNSVPLK